MAISVVDKLMLDAFHSVSYGLVSTGILKYGFLKSMDITRISSSIEYREASYLGILYFVNKSFFEFIEKPIAIRFFNRDDFYIKNINSLLIPTLALMEYISLRSLIGMESDFSIEKVLKIMFVGIVADEVARSLDYLTLKVIKGVLQVLIFFNRPATINQPLRQ